ncbi:serpin family protein [Candidatus Poriferisocius sp.]|uniref:serpin family protein n=1 Tax=Candidatus Poriferisocius sp. TaxID=3101276 RepID=UPI003B021E02
MTKLICSLLVLSAIAVACGTSRETSPTASGNGTPAVTATQQPTSVATAEPTPVATPTATAAPTAQPTPVATPTATAAPTAQPTPVATPTATAAPTAQPTPVATPTATAIPTAQPTPVATPTATAIPTAQPTSVATPTPTAIAERVVNRLGADPDAPVGEWVGGVNAAGWDFHRSLEGNAVSSPLSIGVAFSLSRAGASADPGEALDRVFGFPSTDTHSAANAVDLMLAEASVAPTTLEVANRLFPKDGFSLRRDFLNTATAHYGATVQPVDTADGAAAAATINRWVSERTRGLIPSIVDAGVVQDQELVMVNTVYLKADWLVPFLAEFTRFDQFTNGDGQSVPVLLMQDHDPIRRRFVRLDDADAVELPYQGGDLAMWLIVPRDPEGLAAVEESLDAEALTGLAAAAQEGLVHLTMPKWEQTLPPADLFEWLCPQGFCPGAGLDGIAPGLSISRALHGAKVIVDEKGTEAAAATATAFPTSLPPEPDLTLVADRPFLWAIVHPDTGALLFVGRLVNPAQ